MKKVRVHTNARLGHQRMSAMTIAPGNPTPSTIRRQYASPVTNELELSLMNTSIPQYHLANPHYLLLCVAFALRDYV